MNTKLKRAVSVLLAFVLTVSTVVSGIPNGARAAESTGSDGFVTTDGTDFVLNGKKFRYVGTNCYYLSYKSQKDVQYLMEDAQDMGLTVLRTWGHMDAGTKVAEETETEHAKFENNADKTGEKDGVYFQYWDSEQKKPVVNEGENGLQRLDYVIAQAQEHNIRLILTFTNYWSDFGGMLQYLKWAKLAGVDVTENDQEQFYSNETVKGWYKDYIETMLNHENVYTGVKYKDDPTVFAWELANEPRYNAQKKTEEDNAIYLWAKEMSEFIKNDCKAQQMVAIGDEGGMYYNEYVDDNIGSRPIPSDAPGMDKNNMCYHGGMGNFHMLMDIDTIDFATPHLYAKDWNFDSEPIIDAWLQLHAQVAHEKNKPIILEEFGWSQKKENAYQNSNDAPDMLKTRDAYFKYIYDKMEEYNYQGSNFWMLSSRTNTDKYEYYPDWDGFTVYNFQGPKSGYGSENNQGVDLYGTNEIIKEYAAKIAAENGDTTIAVESVSLSSDTATVKVGSTTELTATVSPGNATNKRVKWSSSDEEIATVSSDGTVTGVAAGEAVITVTSAADATKKATCTVTVVAKDPNTEDSSTEDSSTEDSSTEAPSTEDPTPVDPKPEESLLIDDFSKDTIRPAGGYLWYTNPGYQYGGGVKGNSSAQPTVTWDSEKERMKVELDYSADADKSWSEAKIALWNQTGYDISKYNQIRLDLTYPEEFKDLGIKVYASNPASSDADKVVVMDSVMEKLEDVKKNSDGTYTATMVLFFSPTDEIKLGSINIGFVGKNTSAAGSVYMDNVMLVNAKIEGAIELKQPGEGTKADVSHMPETVKMVDKDATDATKAVFSFLRGLDDADQVLFGHQNDNSRTVASQESDTKDLTGSLSGVVAYDSLAVTGSELGTTTAEGTRMTVASAKEAAAQGAIISLSLHMPNFATMRKEGATDFSKYGFDSSKDLSNNCAESILQDKDCNALYNSYLDIIVGFAKQLQQEDIPIIFRPLHENSGGWFWWGSSTKPEVYKALYRYTVNYLRDAGVHNLIYEYSPNGPIASEEFYLSRYPGDEYVDVLAYDYYSDYAGKGAAYDASFMSSVNSSCAIVGKLAKERGKVAAIAETGVRVTKADGTSEGLLVSGNPIAGHDWYNALNQAAKKNGMAYYLVWANFSNQNFYVPYKFDETTGHELSNEFIDFYESEDSVFANGIDLAAIKEKASSITIEAYDNVSGYMITPTDFAEVPNATSFTAQVVNAAEDVVFEVTVEDEVKASVTASKSGSTYTAEFTDAVMKEIGETDIATVTLKSGDTIIAAAKYVSFNKKKPVMPEEYLDNFEYYFGDQDYLESRYSGSNSAAGCSSSMNITTGNRKDGKYAGRFDYTISYSGNESYTGTGMQLLNTNFTGKDAFSFWIKPDGYGQKLVVQVVSGGFEFEAFLTDFMKGTDAQYVTIPFSALKPKVSSAKFDPSNVTQLYFYCNSVPANVPADEVKEDGSYTIQSSIYMDCMKAIKMSTEDADFTKGYAVSDTPLDGVEDVIEGDIEDIKVTGVTLNKTSLSLKKGADATLTATVSPMDATNKKVSWSSSDDKIVTVVNGKIKAVAVGEATITVTTEDGAKEASCKVTVTKADVDPDVIAVTGITLDQEMVSVEVDKNITLQATIAPENATDKTVTWTTSDEEIATVNSKGVVTGVKMGTANITAEAGGKKAVCIVSVIDAHGIPDVIPVEKVRLDKEKVTIAAGSNTKLSATVEPENATDKTVIWASSDEEVAVVSENGKVAALKEGTAVITATAGDVTAKCTVTVTKVVNPDPDPEKVSVTGVSIDNAKLELTDGEDAVLKATILPNDASNLNVSWESTNDAVVSVEDMGGGNAIVTANKEGTATITVITEDGGFEASCEVTVKKQVIKVPVSGVELDQTKLTMIEGGKKTLTATVLPAAAENKNVAYTSSDDEIASVDQSGKVTANKEGTATITVTTEDGGFKADCKVTVQAKPVDVVHVTGVTIRADETSIHVGKTTTVTAVVAPANATDKSVDFVSSDESVATVSADGTVKGKYAGTVTITAITSDGDKTSEVEIEVLANTDPVTDVSISSVSEKMTAGGDTLKLTATVLPETATVQDVIWESTNQKVATVSKNGEVTAVSAGTAYISVTTVDGNFTAMCKVMVVVPVNDILLDPERAELVVGQTTKLTATVEPTDATSKNVLWSSSMPGVASVDNYGKVTALSAGIAQIIVTSLDGKVTKSSKIVVTNAQLPEDTVYQSAWENVKFDQKSQWSQVNKQDGAAVEYNNDKLTTSFVPQKGFQITANIAIPGVKDAKPDFSGSIKVQGTIRLGENWSWVSSMDIPALSANSFKWDESSKCYVAPIVVTFGDDVKAFDANGNGGETSYEEAVKDKINAVTLTCAGYRCDYEGSIYISDLKLNGVKEMILPDSGNQNQGSTGNPTNTGNNGNQNTPAVVPKEGTIIPDSEGKAIYKVVEEGSEKITGSVKFVAPDNKNATSVVIPDTVVISGVTYKITAIEKNAFKNNKKLTSVKMSKNVTSIGSGAFSGCSKLKSVTIGSKVSTIGDKAFYKCSGLKKITVPSKVSKIGKQTFYGCKQLKTITIKTTKLTSSKVGKQAFHGISKNATIKVPKSKVASYSKILKAKGVNGKSQKIKK